MAEDKIAAAERAALEEVRAKAARAAAAAAEALIRDKLDAAGRQADGRRDHRGPRPPLIPPAGAAHWRFSQVADKG